MIGLVMAAVAGMRNNKRLHITHLRQNFSRRKCYLAYRRWEEHSHSSVEGDTLVVVDLTYRRLLDGWVRRTRIGFLGRTACCGCAVVP